MHWLFPNVLDAKQLASIIATLSDHAPWVDGRVTAGHQGAQVKHNEQVDESSRVAHDLGNLIVAQLERHALFVSAMLPHRVYPPLFNRYARGMHFGTHIDGAIRAIPRTAQKLRTDLSATLFLVAPDSYDGGELVLEEAGGEQSFKLAAGAMIVYPTTSRHRVMPVTRGERVASFFWIQSLIRDSQRRQELHELDRVIQDLTSSGADPDALVRLAGHYHNLLRLWSEF